MINTILTISIILSLQGCKQRTLNYVSYKYAECESTSNVGIKLDSDGVYRCINSDNKVKSVFNIEPKQKKDKPIKKGECETIVTAIYRKSKHIGEKALVICEGKLLEPGQESRIVYK